MGAGAGVLMEWSLSGRLDKQSGMHEPSCRSMQIAHESAIIDMVYGPYDNGPVITCCKGGTFRVWEFLIERGLCCSQQIQLQSPYEHPGMAVEHSYGIYAI